MKGLGTGWALIRMSVPQTSSSFFYLISLGGAVPQFVIGGSGRLVGALERSWLGGWDRGSRWMPGAASKAVWQRRSLSTHPHLTRGQHRGPFRTAVSVAVRANSFMGGVTRAQHRTIPLLIREQPCILGRIACQTKYHSVVHASLRTSDIASALFALHGTPRTYPALRRPDEHVIGGQR
ncbi:hypothetical protein HaLaN_23871 [Haematococcus lacustris]|uniref:Uncharacterized protein n=1 Tax=Haematococcus lacustris TaxID=44745 RepID=A0A6A0A0L5_HAELA|nr:hypothetical protein HaLaN_23871 [Haematococcus lacustris]